MRRSDPRLTLRAIVAGERVAATQRVRDAFVDAGAFIVDVHVFGGLQTVLAFDVTADRILALGAALGEGGADLDPASRAAIQRWAASARDDRTEVHGTLLLVFVAPDPDLTREIPAVPG